MCSIPDPSSAPCPCLPSPILRLVSLTLDLPSQTLKQKQLLKPLLGLLTCVSSLVSEKEGSFCNQSIPGMWTLYKLKRGWVSRRAGWEEHLGLSPQENKVMLGTGGELPRAASLGATGESKPLPVRTFLSINVSSRENHYSTDIQTQIKSLLYIK